MYKVEESGQKNIVCFLHDVGQADSQNRSREEAVRIHMEDTKNQAHGKDDYPVGTHRLEAVLNEAPVHGLLAYSWHDCDDEQLDRSRDSIENGIYITAGLKEAFGKEIHKDQSGQHG